MLKQQLRQKLLQKLTPQQIQVIKLLEIPTYQLEQKIKKELEENPVLEEGKDEFDEQEESTTEETTTEEEEFSVEDYMQDDDDTPYYKLQSRNQSSDNYKKEEIPFSVGISYHEYLRNQLGLRMLDDREHQIAEYLIGNIDDDGYLRREMEAIVDDLAFNENIETSQEEVVRILVDIVQTLDPPGSGARNLQECLILQLNSKNDERPVIHLAINVLEDHFEAFTRKHYDKIISQMNISEDDLKEVINEITHLYPKPGSSYSDSDSKVLEHIVPDFVLENRDGQLILSLNSRNVPDLRLSRTYVDMLESSVEKKKSGAKRNKEAASFVKQKINSAKWFIDAVKQRQTTLMLTMDAILNFQREYFLEGDELKLKPMILKDIAAETDLDISTISRVVNSKYIQTHFGIFPLKYFFSEGMMNQDGEDVSTREIKKILQDCVDNEDKKKPLTDEKLSDILEEKGYNIARRTVAKYREQLGVSVARLRKEL